MSDLRLRVAARAASLDSSPEAQAALLRERLRAGTTTQYLIELAAYCGHEGAKRALVPTDGPWNFAEDGVTHVTACKACLVAGNPIYTFRWSGRRGPGYSFCMLHHNEWGYDMWLNGLGRWNFLVLARAAIAAAEDVFPAWERDVHRDVSFDGPGMRVVPVPGPCRALSGGECGTHEMAKSALAAFQAWREQPHSEDRANACRGASARFGSDEPGFLVWLGLGLYHRHDDDGPGMLVRAACCAAQVVVDAHAGTEAEEGLLASIRADLTRWALRELDGRD